MRGRESDRLVENEIIDGGRSAVAARLSDFNDRPNRRATNIRIKGRAARPLALRQVYRDEYTCVRNAVRLYIGTPGRLTSIELIIDPPGAALIQGMYISIR